MTFAEYNTDENFENPKSSLEELVKIGKSEGKTKEEIKTLLSPKWQNSKKINEFDNYYGAEKDKPSTTPFVEKESPAIKKSDEDYLTETTAIADTAQDKEVDKNEIAKQKRWNETYEDMQKLGEGYKKIDDHYLEQLPRSIISRYKNGEFGEKGSKEAKDRLSAFIIGQVGSAVKALSNGLMQMGGRSPMFSDTTSDYEKFQQTNLAKGMENRWRKYEAETQGAIDLLQREDMDEESIRNDIAKISTNNRLQTAFNMMNEKQKAYLIQVTEEIGDKIGSFNNKKLLNFLIGSAISGTSLDPKEMAEIAIAKFGPDAYKKLKEGKGLVEGEETTAGIGTGGKNKVTLSDGTKVAPGVTMDDKELKDLQSKAEELGNKFYNGEITEEEFKKDYNALEDVMKNHPLKNALSGGIMNYDKYLKQIKNNKLNELSETFESLDPASSDFIEQIENIKEQALSWGASDKFIKSIEKAKKKKK